jgi:hypothetical protein
VKTRLVILSIVFILMGTSCRGVELQQESGSHVEIDSVKLVASYFLIHDIYINSFVISDRDIEEAYHEHKEWVKTFFPTILNEYDLTLYSQFTLAVYLYVEGEEEYLKDLWSKYGRLAGNKEKKIDPNEEFKPILSLLEYFQILLKLLN